MIRGMLLGDPTILQWKIKGTLAERGSVTRER
jgi:hypothetical protein